MSSPTTLAEPTQPDLTADETHFHQQTLNRLIEIGAGLADLIHQQAIANPETPAQPAAEAFERIARAVRRTILLAQKLAEPRPTRAEPAADRAATRRRVLRAVEDTIERTADGDHAEALHAEVLDRLDAPDLEYDLAHRPVKDIIDDICRDLGLFSEPGFSPYKRRTPDDLARLSARAAGRPAHHPAPPEPSRPPPGIERPPLRRAAPG